MATETNTTKPFYNTEIPGDWEVRELGKLVDEKRPVSYGIVQTGESVEGGIPCIRVTDITDGKIDKSNLITTSKKISDGYKRTLLRKGDLVMALRGKIGQIAKIDDDLVGANLTRGVALIALKENYYNDFILQQIASDRTIKIFERNLNGSALQELSIGIVRKIPITIPKSLPEQCAIAHILGLMDKAININNQLIAQKELRKKWLMQQLLTGKKRLKGFGGEWRIQPLESFIKPVVREIPKPDVPYLGIGLRSHGKGTFLKYDEQPEKNSMDNFYVVRPNDLIVNITFAWEQAIAIVRPEDDGALASHRFPTFTFIEGKGHSDFFRFFILQPRMKFMLGMISPGGAGRNRVMSKSDFIKLEFSFPDYDEQTAIAWVLQAADKEINLLKAKAEKLREQKKGLMQVLLTGKKRLKIFNEKN